MKTPQNIADLLMSLDFLSFKQKMYGLLNIWFTELYSNSIRRHCERKHLEIKQFDTLHNLWQVVQNVYFAKSQEKPHIFKHFGLSVPNLRKQNPARIRIRMTQKIILHSEPAFLKQSSLGWYTLGSILFWSNLHFLHVILQISVE